MPIRKSFKKSVQTNEKQRIINKSNKRTMKTEMKKIVSNLTENSLSSIQSLIDKTCAKGAINKSYRNRYKSRLYKLYNENQPQ